MNLEEILNSNVLLGHSKLEMALIKIAEIKGWNYIVHSILNLGCGSIEYSRNGWGVWDSWGNTYEPHACRALNTLKNQGLRVVGVDQEMNETEEFEHYVIDLVHSPGAISKRIHGRFDLVINQNFSNPENTCPKLMAKLRQHKMTVEDFNERLEKAASIVMKKGACYSLFGGFYTTKHKVGTNLVQL